jgi:hypothetical protein
MSVKDKKRIVMLVSHYCVYQAIRGFEYIIANVHNIVVHMAP